MQIREVVEPKFINLPPKQNRVLFSLLLFSPILLFSSDGTENSHKVTIILLLLPLLALLLCINIIIIPTLLHCEQLSGSMEFDDKM